MKHPQWFRLQVSLTVVNVSNCLAGQTRLSLTVLIPRSQLPTTLPHEFSGLN
jgi:hypothetical protein